MPKQSTSQILMVRPAAFGFDGDTATTNAFQQTSSLTEEELQNRAIAEFDDMVHLLDDKGVEVTVFTDTAHPRTPSAIFPNNWFSTHLDNTVALYPMLHSSRRAENDPAVFDLLQQAGYQIDEYLDFTLYEAQDRALEGTGSLVLDRLHGQAFACISPRTDPELVETFGNELDFFPFLFHAETAPGQPIYHTNVMMAIGTHWSVVCDEVIRESDRARVIDALDDWGRELVRISADQMASFAGNMLELVNGEGQPLIVMSEQARKSLNASQITSLEKHGELLPVPVSNIETAGGGSVRCMIAELFLDRDRS